jgi:hypothetical protein
MAAEKTSRPQTDRIVLEGAALERAREALLKLWAIVGRPGDDRRAD